jgi:tetratricopeptide (TPR) repeat protein
MRLALAMIVKGDAKEAQSLATCLKYAAPIVDGIFVTITQPSKEVEEVCNLYKATVSHFEWCNDFSKARNFNFSQVPKDFTHILWLDADDALRDAELLRDVIEEHPEVDAFSLNYLYSFDQWKNPVVVHMKTRVIKSDGCVEWDGALHEDFKENRAVTRHFVKGIEVLHLTSDERIEVNKERNLEVAQFQMEQTPDDPRSYWNLGNSLKACGKNAECIEVFDRFMELSLSDDEKYIVRLRKAESYWGLGKKDKAIDEARYAIGTKPEYPDAYHLLGSLYLETRQYDRAKEMYTQGLMRKPPVYSIIVYNPRDYDYVPLMNLAKVYFNLSLPSLSLICLKTCLEIYPDDENLKNLVTKMQSEADDFEKISKLVVKLQKIEDKDKLKKELDKVPEKYRTHPGICNIRNTRFIKEASSGKDLVYYCGYTSEEWTPETAKTRGIGGSEEAVIHLSKQFSAQGWNVTVYNNCGAEEQVFDGVTYRPYWMWNYRDKQDVTILWRTPRPVDYGINSDKIIIDLHDVIPAGELTPERLGKITKIFVKSDFHRSLFPQVVDDKFVVIPNGIDLSVFEGVKFMDQNLIINTSSPDRSLSACIKAFKKIKAQVPTARFKWAYGWQVWETVHGENAKMCEWKDALKKEMAELDGFEEVGRLGHAEVAELYRNANVFFYPTEFAEIDCISARKAQAAYAYPVTTDFAALATTVQNGTKVHSLKTKDDWCKPYQFDFSLQDEEKIDEMVRATVEQLNNYSCLVDRFDWDKPLGWESIANKWLSELT